MNKIRENLYIGNKQDAKQNGDKFTTIISLSKNSTKYTTHHFPINDGKNKQENFEKTLESILNIYNSKEKTLVHCSAGISRSVTMISLILAHKENIRFDAALEKVKQKHPQSNPSFFLKKQARKAIDQETDSLYDYLERNKD